MRACEKVDSTMDCHALPCKARNDRETPKAQNVICKKVDRILGFLMKKQGCTDFCAEIRLERLSHKQKASSLLYRKKTKSKTKKPNPPARPNKRSN